MAARVQPMACLGAGIAAAAIAASLAWAMWPAAGGAQEKGRETTRETTQDKPTAMTAASPAAQPAVSADPAVPEASPPALASPLDGLKIASQSWRRGGLGSKALMTFTLRNANGYAVKDIEVACAFARRDGSHVTERKRVIPTAVGMKSRKTFTRMHFGFVNVNAEKAKCALVAASRV